jgi:hypothetical protein
MNNCVDLEKYSEYGYRYFVWSRLGMVREVEWMKEDYCNAALLTMRNSPIERKPFVL